MNNEEKILDFIEKVYIELQETKKTLTEKIQETKNDLKETKKELTEKIQETKDELTGKIDSIGNRLSRIEVEHGQKLDALFDGYKLNSEKLDRIEAEVSKHEEIIIKRIK